MNYINFKYWKYRSICSFDDSDCDLDPEIIDFLRENFESYQDFIDWLENYFPKECNVDISNIGFFLLEARERPISIKDVRGVPISFFNVFKNQNKHENCIGCEVCEYTQWTNHEHLTSSITCDLPEPYNETCDIHPPKIHTWITKTSETENCKNCKNCVNDIYNKTSISYPCRKVKKWTIADFQNAKWKLNKYSKLDELIQTKNSLETNINSILNSGLTNINIDIELLQYQNDLKQVNNLISLEKSMRHHNIHDNQRIKWEIENPDEPCSKKVIEGIFKEKNVIFYPALWEGCYNVKCSITTDTVDRKLIVEDCFFRIIPEEYEIIALEKDNPKSNKSVNYNNIKDLQTDWNKYYNYLKQDFNLNYYEQHDIIEITNNGFIIDGSENHNLVEFIHENWNNYYNFYVAKSWFDVDENNNYVSSTKFHVPVDAINLTKIDVSKNWFPGITLDQNWTGYIKLYQMLQTTDFVFNMNDEDFPDLYLKVSDDEIKTKFYIGAPITFKNEHAEMYYIIQDIKYSQVPNDVGYYLEIKLGDNGSLRFPDSRTNQLNQNLPEDLEFVYTFFESPGTTLIYKYDQFKLFVNSIKSFSNSYEFTTSLNDVWDYVKKYRELDWYIDFDIDFGLVEIPTKDIEIEELPNNKFEFKNVPPEILCNITKQYKFLLAPFDIINSNKNIHLDYTQALKNNPSDIMVGPQHRLHSSVLNGFYLIGWNDLTLANTINIKTWKGEYNDIQIFSNNYEMLQNLITTMNDLDCGIHFSFDDNTQLIQGIFLTDVYENMFFEINGPLHIIKSLNELENAIDEILPIEDDKLIIPGHGWIKNVKFEFADYNNENYLQFVRNMPELTQDYHDLINTNIYSSNHTKWFTITNGTRMIFTISNVSKFKTVDFEWQLIKRDAGNKLMVKSNLKHLTWYFNERGNYSIILKDSKNNETTLLGWINVI